MVVPTIVNGMPTGDETCAFNYSKFYPIIGNLERANAFASGSFDLTSHITLFGEFQASRMRTDGISTPAYSVPPPLLVVPANHVDNTFGQAVTLLGRPLGAAAGGKRTSASDDTIRVVGGLRGDFGGVAPDSFLENWEWELAGSWGISRYTLMVPDTLRQPITDAINSCSDPRNLSKCFNPFYSAIDGTGTPNSQSVIDGFSGLQTSIADYSLQTYNAGLTGPLFPLPGGDVAIAFGGELRYEWRTTQLDHDANEQRYVFLLGNTDAHAQRDVYSGYIEVRWPFFRGIELQTAARVEHYTDIDRTSPSPFAGLTLAPGVIIGGKDVAPIWRRLQLTGQVTSAFRAPTLFQSYPGFAVVPTLLNVPGSPVPVFTPVQSFGNPALEPERALVISTGLTWQPADVLNLNVEFWNYIYKDRIALESSTQVLANDISLMSMGGSDPRVIRDPSGAIERVQVRNRNIDGNITTNGIDFTAMMSLSGENFGGNRESWGTVSFGTQGTLTLNYFFPRELAANRTVPGVSPVQSLAPLHCDGNSCQGVGSRNYNNFVPPLPRWRMNIPINWSLKGHSATAIGHLLSGIENDNDVRSDGSLGTFPAYFTLDLQYGYTIRDWFGKELGFRIGVYNLFDRLPPATRDTNGFETLIYDPRGRMVYAKLNVTF
jgi:outer membrane receptor protein involved in Fe transport